MVENSVARLALNPKLSNGPILMDNQGVEEWQDWLQKNRDELLGRLLVHGGILFRGFALGGPGDFETFTAQLIDRWMGYQDRASKRTWIQGNIFTSTDTPAGFSIPLHNESAFTSRWPQKIFFYCEQAADQGGRTPIADVRRVYEKLAPAILKRFEKCGVMYTRTFGEGVGMDWRDVFQVENKEQLAEYCSKSAIKIKWLDEKRLRTVQIRPATLQHPQTGENVWFNHALALHSSSLDPALRATLIRQQSEENFPHNTYFGDGEPISDSEIEHVRQVYEEATSWFEWQAGDVLMLDNLLCAHGREQFSGPRRVYTAMSDPSSWSEAGYVLSLPEHGPTLVQTATSPDGSSAAAIQKVSAGSADWFLAAVARELELDCASAQDNFADLGGDSLSAVALLEEVHDQFGIELDLDAFLAADTLEEILRELQNG